MKAEVHCADGVVGRSTYVIGNPSNNKITHLVVKSYRPPFHEYLVPVDQVEETTDDRIKLKCTRNQLIEMEPFEYEEYRRTETPGYLYWSPHVIPGTGYMYSEDVETHIRVKRRNIPEGEVALYRGARVEATDGYVGQVDELLISSKDMQVTHLVLLVRHIFEKREITIPVSQIDHISESTIYLKLDRQSVGELPTAPIQRWPQKDFPRPRLFPLERD
jgi:sporulation protein YlmC with PRC-barrel domain